MFHVIKSMLSHSRFIQVLLFDVVSPYILMYFCTFEHALFTILTHTYSKEFRVQTILLTDAYFTLERPIVAQSFKFRINDAILDQDRRICWELLIYGCTLENGKPNT